MKTKVCITAEMRVISTIKGLPLIPTETFILNTEIETVHFKHEQIVMAVCNTKIREVYLDHFRQVLLKDVSLKRSIGGTRWSVDVVELKYEVKEEQNA